MSELKILLPLATLLAPAFLGASAAAQDWPMWGRDESRNMNSPDSKCALEIP